MPFRESAPSAAAHANDPSATIAWSEGRTSATSRTNQCAHASRSAVVIRRNDGSTLVKPQGRARLRQMAWQPGGRLLAFFDYAPHGEVLTLDPDTGEQRQIAAAGDFGQVAWAPDGKALATARSQNIVALVDTDGRQVGALPSSGVPLLWLGRE